MDDTLFTVSYDGPNLASHEMDVKDLAPALLAIGELLEEANLTLNGEKVKVAVNIRATSPGSISVDLNVVQNLISQARDLFNGSNMTAIVNAFCLLQMVGFVGDGGIIGLILWIKNRKIKNITKLEGNKFKVELDDKEIRVVSKNEIDLFGSIKIRRSLESIIRKPLEKEGIDKVTFNGGSSQNTIKKDDKDYFSAPELDQEVIDDRDIEMALQIVDVSFRDGGKWRFSDGSSNFFADMKDEEFIKKIADHEEVFAKDDVLRVVARRKQYLSDGIMRADYEITRIIEHRTAVVRLQLPFGI